MYKKIKKINFNLKYAIIIFIIYIYNQFLNEYNIKLRKIGIIGLAHSQNVGNNLVKFSIFIKLKELGFSPVIVGTKHRNNNISFIQESVNLRIIKNFSEINKNDFDILMVNSDQTWNVDTPNFYNIAFLKFAENWKIPKFVYGASLGFDKWKYKRKDEIIAKHLLKSFNEISVREMDSIELIEKHLGLKAQFVLDPTLLINKKYYLNLIKGYKSQIHKQLDNKKFIFVYILKNTSNIDEYIKKVKKKLNIEIFYLTIHKNNQVKEFLYGISHCKGVITNSFHGTVFSIIFKKPFVTFQKRRNDNRLNNLKKIFHIENRIIKLNSSTSVSVLQKSFIVNISNLISLRKQSIDFLKRNLYIK